MQSVLVIYYSQSGQLQEIAESIARPLMGDDIQLTFCALKPEKPFPFPWSKSDFFEAFPESFLQVPAPLEPLPDAVLNGHYDLVLLHYQTWYLTPSIPINSFLKSPEARALLKDRPVVTINGSRNMWVMAQEKVKLLLKDNGARLVGNIALVDRAPNLISVITIVQWMFSGQKRRYLGIFPLPGVSAADVQGASRFGQTIKRHLQSGTLSQLQPDLVSQGAVKISPYLVRVDKTANKLFLKWAKLIISKKATRKKWLRVFNLYLLLAIWLISPIVYILHIFKSPFQIKQFQKETEYYQGV